MRMTITCYRLDAPTTCALPPSTTSLTNPISSASLAPKSRPVSASSRTLLSLPVTLGKRCKVPISAARPTLTSEMANLVSDAHRRISHAAAMSIARPRAQAVECADDGLAAGGEGGDGRLEGEEVAVERECFACRVGSGSEDRLRLDCGALAEVRE